MSENIMPTLQREEIIRVLKSGKRFDLRSPLDYRKIEIKRGISNNAESSVSVKFGKTEVYCGVKLGVTEPYPDSQDEGTFMTTVELHPMSSEKYDIGKPGIDAVEMARVVDRGIRESGFIDFKGLCIKKGEKVWQIYVDIITLNDDGNLFDVCSYAAIDALANAKLPIYNVEEGKLEHELSNEPLPLNKDALSFNMTFYKVGEVIVLDPTEEEEEISDFRLSVAFGEFDNKPRITALQKGKEGVIDSESFKNILNILNEKFKSFFPEIKKMVWNE
jgi:exosome complex component RRP42